jgi:hypothetical protein
MGLSDLSLVLFQEIRLSCEEQLSQIQARIENIRNGTFSCHISFFPASDHPKCLAMQLTKLFCTAGSDDALLEECELLSRDRDELLNRLAVRDSSALNKSKGPIPRQVTFFENYCPNHVFCALVCFILL